MPSNFDSSVVNPINHPNSTYSIKNLYASLKHLQLTWEPGTKYRYSNAAFGLLGTILQKIYNQSYEQLLFRCICKPLHMPDTKAFILNADSSSFAKGYDRNGTFIVPWDHQPTMIGHGGIAASAHDMMQFAKAQSDGAGGILGKAIELTHDTTFSQGPVAIGMAWQYVRPGNENVLFHGGGTGGYTCYFAVNPQKKLAVVILSNTSAAPCSQDGDVLMARLEK